MESKDYKNGISKISLRVLIGLMASISSSLALASGNIKSETLVLSAFVNEVVSIKISPKGNYSNLDLSSTSIDLPVATIYESSNSSSGYFIKARSENNSTIKSVNGSVSIPYSIKYGGNEGVSLANQDKIIKNSTSTDVVNSAGSEVSISFKGVPATKLVSGLYNDIITFTIESR